MLVQFLVEVSRNPPSTAQPKPKNISCACHWIAENEFSGTVMAPANISAHRTGRLKPDKHARAKNGRKPASQRGCDENLITNLCKKIWSAFLFYSANK